jgi:hypothetical protein
LSMLLVNVACPCCMSVFHVHAACSCCMSMLNVLLHGHEACLCCMTLLHVHAVIAFPCYNQAPCSVIMLFSEVVTISVILSHSIFFHHSPWVVMTLHLLSSHSLSSSSLCCHYASYVAIILLLPMLISYSWVILPTMPSRSLC